MTLSNDDQRQLESHGIDLSRANRQLEMLRAGQSFIRLARPCTPGDGLLQIAPEALPQLTKHFDQATSAGRLTRFVPASGAASRMFKPLYVNADTLSACRANRLSTESGPEGEALCRFLDCLPDFAFYEDLAKTMADDGQDLVQKVAERDLALILRSLLEPEGLGYGHLPKGLLAFHREADGARTPFVEHLAEAALANGCSGVVQIHFTVSQDHQALFEAQFAAWEKTLQANYGCQFDVSFSVQKSSTDTLSLSASGQPLRDGNGRLVLRPGGHGALIENLNDLLGDIVLLRNIDNVVPDVLKTANLNCTKILTGLLLILQQEQHALIRALKKGVDGADMSGLATTFLVDQLQIPVPQNAGRNDLIALLDRPLRVCGMVPNTGEPGGGPFWVKGKHDQLSRQIVEGAQIDTADPDQNAVLMGATHFNPVDMVCSVRDWQGQPYDLRRFVDEDAVIVTEKSLAGESIRVLELPGLWNGAMAGWHTLFVEIPQAAFNPVKTVFDLLRPAHQP